MSLNVGLIRTKAEQGYADSFSAVAGSLPGGTDVLASRKAAISRFKDLGLPNRRVEAWKYTDLRALVSEPLPLLIGGAADDVSVPDVKRALGPVGEIDGYFVVFVDGGYRADLSNVLNVEGVSVSSLAEIWSAGRDAGLELSLDKETADEDVGVSAVLALNTAYASDGYVIEIDDGVVVDKPIIVADLRLSGQAGFTATRNRICLGENADCTVVEAYASLPGAADDGQANTLCEVTVGASSRLSHIKCARGSEGMAHLSNLIVDIAGGADYRGFSFAQGIGVVRNQVRATFMGEDAKVNLSGAFLARGREHVDNTLVVDHRVPGCESRELFKGVLDDRARGIVQGKVIVRPDAQKTDGMQMANVLMLSPDAEFDSKPELEIYADDVVCGHGSTAAEIDADLLFYCRSRGIPEAQARSLLVQSFVGEALEVIESDGVVAALSDIVGAWLEKRDSK